MTATPPFSWTSPHWGQPGHNVHQATEPGDKHTDEVAES